jgi:hypothetical protein
MFGLVEKPRFSLSKSGRLVWMSKFGTGACVHKCGLVWIS